MSYERFNKKHFLLDIETSGLKKDQHLIVTLGVTFFNGEEWEIKQWSIDQGEQILLESFLSFCQNYEHVFTYNGKGFDWPFLLTRLAHHGLSVPTHLMLIDFKKILKPISPQRITLEKTLAFHRHTQSSGKDLVQLYKTYESSKVATYLTLIKAHNQDELRSLQLFYDIYYVLYELKHLVCEQVEQTETQLRLFFHVDLVQNFSFSLFPYNLKVNANQLIIEIELFKERLLQALSPLKDYYYIESQKQLLHKSLASFIPKSERRPATKDEAVIEQEGTYLKLLTTYKVNDPLWYNLQKEHYILLPVASLLPSLVATQLFYQFFQN